MTKKMGTVAWGSNHAGPKFLLSRLFG